MTPRADIEGLRALAVLLVLAFHFAPEWLPGGYVGVDVFFVVSGYVITGALCARWTTITNLGTWLVAFWAARFRRLLPNALLVLCGIALVAWMLLPPQALQRAGSDIAWAAVWMSNWQFIRLANDYMNLAAGSPNRLTLHFWSLGVVAQFYILWPLILAGTLAARRRSGDRPAAAAGTFLIAGLAVLSFGYCVWVLQSDASRAFYAVLCRGWEFLAGALVARSTYVAARVGAAREPVAALAAVGLAAAALGFSPGTAHPGFATLLPVIATMLLLAAHEHAPTAVSRVLGSTAMQAVGRRSYSLYLWHWPVLVFGERLMQAGPAERALVLLAVTLVLSELAWRLVENPARFEWMRRWSPQRTLAAALCASLLVAGAGWLLRSNLVSGLRLGVVVDAAALGIPDPTAVRDDLPAVYRDGCHLDLAATQAGPCVYGARGAATHAVLFGDSHAAQWFSALEIAARQEGVSLHSWTKSGCPPLQAPVWRVATRSTYRECEQWLAETLDRIDRLRPRWVILSGVVDDTLAFSDASGRAREVDARTRHLRDNGFATVLRRIAASGARVVLIEDTPRVRDDVIDCLVSFGPQACETELAPRVEQDASVHLLAQAHGAALWDFNADICPGGRCPAFRPDQAVVVFRDGNHLTDSQVRDMAPLVLRRWRLLASQP